MLVGDGVSAAMTNTDASDASCAMRVSSPRAMGLLSMSVSPMERHAHSYGARPSGVLGVSKSLPAAK